MVHNNAIKLGFSALLLSGIFILASPYLIDLMYGYGKLDAESRSKLSHLLSCYLLGAGPFIAGIVYVRTLSAQGKIHLVTWIAGLSIIVNFTMNYLLTRIFGLNGIGLATATTYLFSMILLAISYHKRD